MGNCCRPHPEPPPEFEYPEEVKLKITKTSGIDSMIGNTQVDFLLTKPITQTIFSSQIGPRFMKISGCILPGIDPKGDMKPCQDNYKVISFNGTLFCILFDGHGVNGHQVSSFCIDFTSSFISNNYSNFISSPKQTIIRALESCDQALAESDINTDLSGSTGILLMVADNSIHTGCLGDSRAILGTLTDYEFPFTRSTNPYARSYTVTRMLKPIPLTTDQKPDNTEEIIRIRRSGGIIEKFGDSFSPNGHYRVCLPESGSALSMTRSLGDKLAKNFGVINTPVYQYFSMQLSQDQYIVIASDGIWDVMDNCEVLNFIEMWADRCSEFANDGFPANNRNCILARLLAEECRLRWLHHVQNEGAVIDDISCIVVNFAVANENLYGSMIGAEKLNRVSRGFKHLE